MICKLSRKAGAANFITFETYCDSMLLLNHLQLSYKNYLDILQRKASNILAHDIQYYEIE